MDPDHFFDLIPLHYTLRFLGPPGLIMPLWLPPGGLTLLQRLADAVGEGGRFLNGFETHEYDPAGTLDVGDVTISFGPMKHFVEAWGMRLGQRASDLRLVYTADTAYSPEVVRLLQAADLAIVEATLLEYRSPIDSEGHSTARIAAEMAREAGVKRLLLTHYEESLAGALLADASKIFPGRVELAVQGQEYDV
jgi:ribonuclease BN (tRNA processing enzyme)